MVIRELVTLLRFEAKGVSQVQETMRGLQSMAYTVAASFALLGGGLATMIARAGDQMTGDLNKLEAGLGSAAEASRVYELIYNSAKDTGVAVTETATSFGRYWLAMQKVGRTADETVDLVSGLQIAMANTGVSAAGAAAVTLQLGQALGKGFLNGDELVTLREQMPQLMESIRKELRYTDEAFSKAAEKKELTAARLIGPLMAYAKTARQQLGNLAPTMSRSIDQMRVVWTKFIADLDRQLGFSQTIARNLSKMRDWLEGLRRYLPAIGQFTRELGGMDAILRVLAIGLGIATAGFVALNRALLGTLLRFLAIPAAIGLIALGLEDLSVWMRGGDSLLGRKFGSFETVLGGIKNALGPFGDALGIVRDTFSSTSGLVPKTLAEFKQFAEWGKAGADLIRENWPGISAIFTGLFRDVAPALGGMNRDFEALKTLLVAAPGLIKAAWTGITGFFTEILEGLGTAFDKAWERVRKVADDLKDAAKALIAPQGDPSKPSLNGAPIPLFNAVPDALRSPAAFGAQFLPRMGDGGVRTANINATNTNNTYVTATGVSGAEVAAAAQSGVGRANATSPLNGDALARAFGVASPRVEAAAA